MKFNKSYFFFLTITVVLFSTSCKKDTIGNCNNNFSFATELEAELIAISTATTAYVQDSSTENCNAFKKAYEDYLDAAKEWNDCAESVGQGTEFQAAIKEAEDSLKDLECG